MSAKSFNYYGYTSETYQDCLGLIKDTNRKHVEMINLWFVVINLLYLIFSVFNMFGVTRARISFYVTFSVISFVFEILLFVFRKFLNKYHLLMVYISVLMLLGYSISASISQPYLAAAMYLVMVVLAAVSYIDTMLRMSAVLVAVSLVFIYSSWENKPTSIAYQDIYNVLVFLSLALVLHYSFQHARIRQFETYQKNIQIQRELEVKSSFDALTSLLNRARFFSMAGQVLRDTHEGEYLAIGLLDLDGFKQVNDTLGHQMGDKVIQMAGSKILESMGIDLTDKWSFPERAVQQSLSFAGRLGGDEFIVFIRGMHDSAEIHQVMEKMLADLNNVQIEGLDGIHASIGVSEIGNGDTDIDKIYSRIDNGLYESKKQGKNRVTFV